MGGVISSHMRPMYIETLYRLVKPDVDGFAAFDLSYNC